MNGREVGNWFDRNHLGAVNLILYAFVWHSREETEELASCRPVAVEDMTASWPRPWLWSRALALFAVAFAMLYCCWILDGGGRESQLLPGLTIIGSLAFPLSMVLFFFEINKFRSVSLLRALQYFFVGSCMSVVITFLLMELPVTLDFLFEEAAKAVAIFIFLMHYRDRCHILQGLLIGAAVGAGFSVFESAGYAFNDTSSLLSSVVMRNLVAPACHTAWGAILGAGTMMITRNRLNYWKMLSPRFILLFLFVCSLHWAWNTMLDFSPYLTRNIQLAIFTVFIVFLLIWAGMKQVERLKAA